MGAFIILGQSVHIQLTEFEELIGIKKSANSSDDSWGG